MPISYQQTLVADVIAAVSARLYDNGPQWETDELTDLITEALQTWNALSQFWRSEMIVPLIQNQWWYDLRTVSGSLVPYTTTQSTIVKRIQSHLLEPPTPTVWTGSAQFSLNDIFGACQRRQNDTIGESACTITRTLVPADIVRRTFLPGTTIDIRRVAWLPASGFGYSNRILKQSDQWATRAYNTGYVQAGQKPPSKWLQNSEPPPSFDVDSTPPSAGQYEVLLTQSGPVWSVGNSNATFGIPDDWSWVFKWGALGDLLGRESNASDTLRAAYCRSRYMEGIALLRMMPIVLAVRINDKPVSVGAVKGGDTYNATWQAKAAGAPKSVYDFMNVFAVAPKPDATSAYSATVSVCPNAPIGNAYIQIAEDDVDTIIDYVQHLAMFKQGGQEFANTIPLYQSFQKKAASYNGKLTEMGFFSMDQFELSDLDEARNARFRKGTEPTTASV